MTLSGDTESHAPEQPLTIGKMAEQFNVTLRALRFYESSGLLTPQRRGTTRFYNSSDCQRLEMILRGRQLGFTLTEIRDFIHASDGATENIGLESLIEPEQIVMQIRNLERQRAELDKAIQDLNEMYEKMSNSYQSRPHDQNVP
jgi:DNA-binding transcriptional MerR regulator